MKTQFKVYRLHFTTPLHLGDEKEDYSESLKTFHSDSLYAALMAVLAKVGREIPKNGDLKFTTSTLFPFYQKDETSEIVYFFPKMLIQYPVHKKWIRYAKVIKKVKWLDQDYFQKQINGYQLFDEIFNISDINEECLSNKTIDPTFIHSQVFPRVTVSRTGLEDAKPFYMERLFFKGNSGFFFLAMGDSKILEKALEILKYEGIGTDRNVGNGFFNWIGDTIVFDLPSSEFITNLSLFCPENTEQLKNMLNDESVAYDIIRRGGWITTPPFNSCRKNSINMFSEGSVFKSGTINNCNVFGRIVNLIPEILNDGSGHPIWRSGRSLFFPIKIVAS